MTSSEKRSFKIFAKRHVIGGDQNNYVLLFDTLDKMSEYDEQKLKKELYDIIAQHSGQTYEKVEKDSDRDYWMVAEEAKAYGMIDELLVRNTK